VDLIMQLKPGHVLGRLLSLPRPHGSSRFRAGHFDIKPTVREKVGVLAKSGAAPRSPAYLVAGSWCRLHRHQLRGAPSSRDKPLGASVSKDKSLHGNFEAARASLHTKW